MKEEMNERSRRKQVILDSEISTTKCHGKKGVN